MLPSITIEFPAIAGIQAGRPQYATVWSLDLLLRLTDECLGRLLRDPDAAVDSRFIRRLADELSEDIDERMQHPFMLALLGEVEFLPDPTNTGIGTVRIDANTRIQVLDGLHRLAALRQANLHPTELSPYQVPVLLLPLQSDEECAKCRGAVIRSRERKPRASWSARKAPS